MPTHIQWTDETWNPVSGCTRISAGCDHCYIDRTPPFRMQHRRFDSPEIGGTTGVQLHPDRLTQPWSWRKPRKVFACSLADLFHDAVPDDHIAAVFGAMVSSPRHTFQVLTKRPARMRSLLSREDFRFAAAVWAGANSKDGDNVHDWVAHGTWPWPNIWCGITAENQQWADVRIPILLDTPAAVRFVSAEPLLGPVTFRWAKWAPLANASHLDGLNGIDWVIGGGESGPGARPSHPDWFRSLRDQCEEARVAYHFKQWGEWIGTAAESDAWWHREPAAWIKVDDGQVLDEAGAIADGGSFMGMHRVGKKAAGRLLDGRTWDEFPPAHALAPPTTERTR